MHSLSFCTVKLPYVNLCDARMRCYKLGIVITIYYDLCYNPEFDSLEGKKLKNKP